VVWKKKRRGIFLGNAKTDLARQKVREEEEESLQRQQMRRQQQHQSKTPLVATGMTAKLSSLTTATGEVCCHCARYTFSPTPPPPTTRRRTGTGTNEPRNQSLLEEKEIHDRLATLTRLQFVVLIAMMLVACVEVTQFVPAIVIQSVDNATDFFTRMLKASHDAARLIIGYPTVYRCST